MTRNARWLTALAIMAALPIVAAVIAASTIDPNDYKPRLIDAVQTATGRTLTLDGPLRITWSLWPTLQVNGARLSNLPGGTRPDMATAERIEAQLSLPALLAHRLDVLQLNLVGPNVLFEVANAKPNWVLTGPTDQGVPAPPSGAPFDLRIRAVHIQNGMVTWRLPAATRVVGLRAFDLHAPQDGALDLGGTLVYGDNQPFTLQAAAQATAGLHAPWRTNIEFAAYDTTAHAQGTMSLAGDYGLDIDARSGALEKLNALLPDMALPAVHGVTLSAHAASNPVLGSLPTLGPAHLTFDSADLGPILPGLALGSTTLALPAPGELATIASQGRFAGQTVTLAGTAGVPRRPDERNIVPVDLTAKAAGGTITLAGKLQLDGLHFAGLDAAATLHAPALAALRPLLTSALPALTEVKFTGMVAIPGHAGAWRFTKAALSTAEADAAGDGSVTFTATGLTAIHAKLHANRVDLDALLQAFDPASSAGGPAFTDRPLPWTAAGGPLVDLAATFGTAIFRQQTWRDGALSLQQDRGKRAASLRLVMPNGRAEIALTADAAAAAVPVSLSVTASGVPLALLAQYADLPGTVAGSARLQAALHGAGRTVHDLAGSLDGPFSLSAVGGQLSNAAFIKLTAGSLEKLGIQVPPQGETALRCVGLAGTASNGVLRLRTIALETTYLSLSGAGQVDLGRQTLALKLHPLAQVGGSPVAVPVVVEGPFGAITGRLDATGLDKMGLLIDGLFGGDAPDTCSDAGLAPAHPPSHAAPAPDGSPQ